MGFDISEFKNLFVSDTEEQIQHLNKCLLALEKNPRDLETLNNIMRFLHNIKGTAASVEFTHMSAFAHQLESVFDLTRHGNINLIPQRFKILFTSIDALNKSLENIKASDVELNLENEKKALDDLINTAENVKKNDGKKFSVEFKPQKDIEIGLSVKEIENIKVPIERLDLLVDLSGSLLLPQMNLRSLLEDMQHKFKRSDPVLEKFENIYRNFSSLIRDLQYYVLQIRLMSLEHIFSYLPRVVHDIAQQEGKEVNLEINGGQIEVDRSIVHQIGNPLAHLLRNAVDHGIEKKGVIRVTAKKEGSVILISVEDNGKGLDLEKILAVAVKNGIIDESKSTELKKLIPQKKDFFLPAPLKDILCHPMISTSTKVTEVSGRGAGINAVKKFADAIGGTLQIEALSQGTRFTMELPLTLAIIRTLSARVQKNIFLIPFLNIIKILYTDTEKYLTQEQTEIFLWNKKNIPFLSLRKIFSYPHDNNSLFSTVIIKTEDGFLALGVDEIMGEQESLVKTYPSIGQKKKWFSGAVILNNGKIGLILDPHTLMEKHTY